MKRNNTETVTILYFPFYCHWIWQTMTLFSHHIKPSLSWFPWIPPILMQNPTFKIASGFHSPLFFIKNISCLLHRWRDYFSFSFTCNPTYFDQYLFSFAAPILLSSPLPAFIERSVSYSTRPLEFSRFSSPMSANPKDSSSPRTFFSSLF